MSTRIDDEKLRVVAHAVLQNVHRLVGEGLQIAAVEKITAHALALTAKAAEIVDRPERQRMHGLGLWELLSVLAGPVSTTLLHWLDDALGSAP
ncbi:hypothetical protein [Actinomycetospora sp. NBC_00405]|uniref:hypothetical protein n=1 Tax=Actinomycetospora sp. NBC_00405 TaxID=2975952 RepID=UPI002E1AFBBB